MRDWLILSGKRGQTRFTQLENHHVQKGQTLLPMVHRRKWLMVTECETWWVLADNAWNQRSPESWYWTICVDVTQTTDDVAAEYLMNILHHDSIFPGWNFIRRCQLSTNQPTCQPTKPYQYQQCHHQEQQQQLQTDRKQGWRLGINHTRVCAKIR